MRAHETYTVGLLKPKIQLPWHQARCVCNWRGTEFPEVGKAENEAIAHGPPMVKHKDKQPAPHEIEDAKREREIRSKHA